MALLPDGLRVKHSARIDDLVFKLHYRLTSPLLFFLGVFLLCCNIYRDPMTCSNKGRHPQSLVNSLCWNQPTYTSKLLSKDSTDNFYSRRYNYSERENIPAYPQYYQLMPWILILQSIVFYAPHWLWKSGEGGKVSSLVTGLSIASTSADRRDRITNLRDYINNSMNSHRFYAVKLILCELYNLLNAISAMIIMIQFLVAVFTVNPSVISESDNLFKIAFPREIGCTYLVKGNSGSLEIHTYSCSVKFNANSEIIFRFFLSWISFLIIVDCLAFIYRLVWFVPALRNKLLEREARRSYSIDLRNLLPKLNFGDHFLIDILSKNVDLVSFASLLEELSNDTNKIENVDLGVGKNTLYPYITEY